MSERVGSERVVVTGLGVLAPNAYGTEAFAKALRDGKSGIRHVEELAKLSFGCQVGGIPEGVADLIPKYFLPADALAMNDVMTFGAIAAIDAYRDAGLKIPAPDEDEIDADAGAIIGTGIGGTETFALRLFPAVNAGRVRRMGSTMVEQIMASAVSARIGGILALGNQVTTNSSACNTGSEAIIMGYQRIQAGLAKRMLVGGAEGASPYTWSGFDAMRVLNPKSNDKPEQASRPMSASAGGFVPGSGAGMLVIESLSAARKRGAKIYAEILGADINCGGMRFGGSMTAPSAPSVRRCIRTAVTRAGISPADIDYINGHLTATIADPSEIGNWSAALERKEIPMINSTKSLIGHALGAAGAIECVGTVLQLHKGFVHGSLNCEDLHEEIRPYAASIVQKSISADLKIAAKASFGFGDVNGCIIFKKWEE